jgi:hypothetical protein
MSDTPEKKNRTPDLTDEQYMEQLFLIAQAIAVMPGQRDGMPNVTTPPPIRARWAAFMISLGLRITPQLATHRLVSDNTPAAGNWGPRERVSTGMQRSTMNRADLMEVWKRTNPDSFENIQNGTMTREQLVEMLPNDIKQAMRMAQKLQEQEKGPGGDAT